jgi:hypothetical protein
MKREDKEANWVGRWWPLQAKIGEQVDAATRRELGRIYLQLVRWERDRAAGRQRMAGLLPYSRP